MTATATPYGPGRLATAALVAATSAMTTLVLFGCVERLSSGEDHVLVLAVLGVSCALLLVATLLLTAACGVRQLSRRRGR